ncbi:MAG: aldehyde dehydrogenase family protein [Patescibacteria group bacterium]|nr:aldehyde dehydrogenase family protein [Patescibacteria group bacterium]
MDDSLFVDLFDDREQKTYKYFDGISWKKSNSGRTIPVLSPHDQTVVGNIQAVTKQEIDDVINNAIHVQSEWEQTSLKTKIDILKKSAKILRDYQDIFTEMLVIEIGKTRHESRIEVLRTADIIEFCVHEIMSIVSYTLKSDVFPGYKDGIVSHVRRVAHGVVLAIGPFNYPLNLVASKIAPAILMGNCVVVKPPTQGSISGLLLTQAFVKAGLPQGVLSCVTGEGREIGDYLTTHPGISMIAFTGSSNVGQSIAQKVGMKPLLFECGGNNAVIVLPDADMNMTAKEIIKGGFSYAGQRCTGIKYVLGTQETFDALLPLVLHHMNEMVRMGDPRNEETKLVGPVISIRAAEEIEQVIHEAVSQGANIITGGKRQGAYIEPTILSHVLKDMRVVKEETFGPVVSCMTVSSVEEAIQIINGSMYGLQASIFTLNESLAHQIAQCIHAGTVQINGSPQRGPDNFPFLGIKASGLGVQGIRYSLEAMSRIQSIVINPIDKGRATAL